VAVVTLIVRARFVGMGSTLEEASFTGEISSPQDAIQLARLRLDGGG